MEGWDSTCEVQMIIYRFVAVVVVVVIKIEYSCGYLESLNSKHNSKNKNKKTETKHCDMTLK